MDDMLSWLSRIPGWLQISWMLLGFMFIILVVLTARYRTELSFDQRLAALSQQQAEKMDEILRAVKGIHPYQIGQIPLPEEAPEVKMGWQSVIIDTTGAESLETVDSAKVSRLFSPIRAPDALVSHSQNGSVSIESLTLVNATPDQAKNSGGARYEVALELRNLTDREVHLRIPRGQVFENTKPKSGFQNLVVPEESQVEMPPHGWRRVTLPGLCLNHGLRAPVGQPGYIAPLQVLFEFTDQGSLWEGVREAVSDRE